MKNLKLEENFLQKSRYPTTRLQRDTMIIFLNHNYALYRTGQLHNYGGHSEKGTGFSLNTSIFPSLPFHQRSIFNISFTQQTILQSQQLPKALHKTPFSLSNTCVIGIHKIKRHENNVIQLKANLQHFLLKCLINYI
jgi:hypothetical protein